MGVSTGGHLSWQRATTQAVGATDSQRARARQIARAFRSFHVAAGHPDNQIADSLNGEDIHYRGALAELVFAAEFCCDVDETLHADGDICDTWLTFSGVRYQIDVKAISFKGPNPRMLVPCNAIKPRTIYVSALYDEDLDDVELLGWEWGCTLIKLDQRRVLNRRGVPCYTRLIRELRPISDLKGLCDEVWASLCDS